MDISRESPYTIQPLRRLLSILLVALMGLTAVSPLFALTPTRTELPACCRKAGKHHCEGTSLMSSEKRPAFSAQVEKCPYCQISVVSSHPNEPAVASRQSTWNVPAIHAASLPHMQSARCSAADSLQYKRGPPVFLL